MAMRGPLETMGGLGFEIRDPQRFASNMARLMQETGKAAMALAAPHATGLPNAALAEDIVPIAKTFAQVQQFWLTQPMKVLAAQTRLWQSYADLWNASFQQMVGAERRARSRRRTQRIRASRTRPGRRASISTSCGKPISSPRTGPRT